jgi:hypothetical protein
MRSLRLGARVTVGDVELIPVETVTARADLIDGFLVATAAREPVAIVVRSGAGWRSLDLDGQEIPVDDLVREIEELKDVLG